MKKVFAAVLALVMALSLTTLAFATEPEIDPPVEAEEEIKVYVSKAITKAGPATDFVLEVLDYEGNSVGNVTITKITTDGTQATCEYVMLSGQNLYARLTDGIYIREVARADGWKCDPTIWHIKRCEHEVTVYAAGDPTIDAWRVTGMGDYGLIYDGEADPVHTLIFENEYTSTPRYYYNSTTTTEPAPSPKTFDAGIALYAALSLTSLTGMAALGRKKF